MTRRRHAMLVVSSWLAGWLCFTASLTGIGHAAAPSLPLWIIPVASAGLLLWVIGGIGDLLMVARHGLRNLIEKGQR